MESSLRLFSFIQEFYILNFPSFSIEGQFITYPLLFHKSIPVKFAFTHWIDLSTSVVYSPHYMIQILIGNVSLPFLKFLRILICLRFFWMLLDTFFLNHLELSGFFVHQKLFPCKYNSFVRFKRLTTKYFLCHFQRTNLISLYLFLERKIVIILHLLI